MCRHGSHVDDGLLSFVSGAQHQHTHTHTHEHTKNRDRDEHLHKEYDQLLLNTLLPPGSSSSTPEPCRPTNMTTHSWSYTHTHAYQQIKNLCVCVPTPHVLRTQTWPRQRYMCVYACMPRSLKRTQKTVAAFLFIQQTVALPQCVLRLPCGALWIHRRAPHTHTHTPELAGMYKYA